MNQKKVEAFYENIFAALSDVLLDIHEVVEDEIQLACRLAMHGTHTGPLAGVAPTGRRVSQPGITICVFDEDEVAQRYSVADCHRDGADHGVIPECDPPRSTCAGHIVVHA